MSRVPELLGSSARSDIQGFVTSGYGHLPLAAYLFVRVDDPAAGRRWIDALTAAVMTSAPWPVDADGSRLKPTAAVNVAFTADGLAACGLPASILCTFPPEFREGIAWPARSRILGDIAESAPTVWEFGGPCTEPVHAVLLIYARDQVRLDEAWAAERSRIRSAGDGVVELQDAAQQGYRPGSDTEPFGFRDGIAQPLVAGLAGHGVPTGEFILGYPNHYDVIPPAPVVDAALDPGRILPVLESPYHGAGAWRDLGRHGTFVVYRKLEQDVAGFWRALREESIRQRGAANSAHMIWLASKMVGRWPGGAPLVESPHGDDPGGATSDDFEYGTDPDGLACPIGAHIRRAHPRDGLRPYPAEQSRHMSEAHRLLRRARVFGPPLFDPALLCDPARQVRPDGLLTLDDDRQPRGVHFFCVNASIRSQFEFVQQTWCNNPSFGGLSNNRDPLVGDHGEAVEWPTRMVIPTNTGVIRTGPLPRFVTVRGGAYLFMPGLRALQFLAAGSYA